MPLKSRYFFWLLPLVVSFIRCNQPGELSKTPSQYFSPVKFLLDSTNVVPVNIALSELPWKNWDIHLYRPKAAFRSFLTDFKGKKITSMMIEFPEEHLAYGAFKKHAAILEPGDFFYLINEAFVLQTRSMIFSFTIEKGNNWTAEHFREFKKIKDPDYTFPQIFNSFPVQGRQLNSMQVYPLYFLGLNNLGETVGIRYQCLFESAFLFRIIDIVQKGKLQILTSEFHGHINTDSTGQEFFWGRTEYGEPLYLSPKKWGFLGVLGCSDKPIVEELAAKTSKMSILLP